jgi:tol-pal system protein YbgF
MIERGSMARWLGAVAFGATLLAPAVPAAVPVEESQGTPVRGPASGAARPAASAPAQSYPTTTYPGETYPAETYPAQSYPTEAPGVEAYPAVDAAPAVTATQSYPVAAAPVAATGGGGSAQAELFSQLQTLQTEVQELRGLVEEQRHVFDRLERQQKEQYLDLDRLMTELRGSGAATPAAGAGPVAVAPASSSGPSGSAPGAPTSERDAYTAAFNLTRDKRFEEAIAAFNQQLVDFPNGEYAGNAFYWLGELYLALPTADLEKARQSFAQVAGQFPNHAKVPDALYKLGVVYHRLGDSARAKEYLDQTQRRFPGTPAARLAQAYATEIR